MRRTLRRRPSPALVISVISLFVSLGGVSYGVATGSISSREIANSTIRGKDVRNNSLTGADVRSLRGGDIRNNSITGSDIDEGTLGVVRGATFSSFAVTLGGTPASGFARANQGLKGAFEWTGSAITKPFNAVNAGAYVLDADNGPNVQFSFPYPLTDKYVLVSGGITSATSSTCFHSISEVDSNTIEVGSDQAGGGCEEPYTVVVF